MQFDQTTIVIRERNFAEILDLATQVVRAHWWPLLAALALGSVPWVFLNDWLLGGWTDPNEIWHDPYTYLTLMTIAMALEAPLATAPVTLYLGAATFRQDFSARQLVRDWCHSLPQLVLLQGLIRSLTALIVLVGLLIPYLAWPYLSEVILLERNPLRARRSSRMTTIRRTGSLHRHAKDVLFGRWMVSLAVGLLLILASLAGVFALVTNLTGSPPNSWQLLRWYLPSASWLVVGFFAVVRFLAYLDLRIRREGWEVELKMRAEAARLLPAVTTSLIIAGWLLVPAGLAADLSEPEIAIEAGRQALQTGRDPPWYDGRSDGPSRIDVRPPQQSRRSLARNSNWQFHEWISILGWLLIAVLLAIAATALVRAFLNREVDSGPATDSRYAIETGGLLDRVSALPIDLLEQPADFLTAARRAYEMGKLTEAIVYLFSYQLIELDKCQLLRLAKGKTNRQYLGEVRRRQPSGASLDAMLGRTMLVFEEAFFGKRTPQPDAMTACWSDVEQFHQQLASQSRGGT